MNARRSRMAVFAVLAGSVGVGGCESSNSAPKEVVSTTEVTVTGKVSAKGSAISKGKVTVSPPGPPFVERIAEIRTDGTYEVKTFIGKNSFAVTGTGSPTAGDSYNKASYDVKEGSNTIDLELPLIDK